MYALLDVADRVGWAKSAGAPVQRGPRCAGEPTRRAGVLYTFNRAYWESRFYDEATGRVPRCAGAEPLQLAGRHLRLRERRLPRAVLSLFLRRGGFPTCAWSASRRAAAAQPRRAQPADPDGPRPRAEFTVGIGTTSTAAACRAAAFPERTKHEEPVPGLVWGVTGENLSLHQGALASS